jgi:segregation and condensation protein A
MPLTAAAAPTDDADASPARSAAPSLPDPLAAVAAASAVAGPLSDPIADWGKGRRRPSVEPFALLPPLRLQSFEGPLDLLLHLVRAGRMDIFDLPIATLCGQYLAYMTAMEELDLAVAGEFLVMAATLLEIKSRLLLPTPPKADDSDAEEVIPGVDPDDPRAELVRRLLEYGKYQVIAEGMRQRETERKSVFFRDAPDPRTTVGFALPPKFGELSADDLLRTLERLLSVVGAGERSVTSVRRQKITLRMKMREVLSRSEQQGPEGVILIDLLPEPPFALLEVVLLFLAILELMKSGSLIVAQERFCGEIRVFFVPEPLRAALFGENSEEGVAAVAAAK